MSKAIENNPAELFFLDTNSGKRFCIYYPPDPGKDFRGTFLYIHPFGEEMNKTRHMVALQARIFSHLGYGVLQIDLLGCGDSFGEFSEMRWEIWKQDIFHAFEWMKSSGLSRPVNLWGLRLGALLALDFARDYTGDLNIQTILLWQPVLNGHSFLTQFLRINLVKNLHSDSRQNVKSVNELRELSYAGETLEVAGYEISSELLAAIDNLKLSEMTISKGETHWLDIVSDKAQTSTPAKARVMDKWKKEDVNLHYYPIIGPSFWATQEIVECPQLLNATTAIFTDCHHAF